jgi:hypothetical protein
MSKRQISSTAANVEYLPGEYRQVSSTAANIEYLPGAYRQVSNVALLVEYMSDGAFRQWNIDTEFTERVREIRTDPLANINVENYRNAIQNGYGVSFEVEANASAWDFLALWFAESALSATAQALERWVIGEIDRQALNPRPEVDRLALFRRVFGGLTITNVAEERNDAVALVEGISRLKVFRLNNQQRTMTPNNLIHELGHILDNRAGFGFKLIGSMTFTVDDVSKGGGNSLHDGYSRKGMAEGRTYLREITLEHSRVEDVGNNTVSFQHIAGKNPLPGTPEYGEFVPIRFLFYPIAGTRLDVWRSPLYTTRYGTNARIDVLVHNNLDSNVETVADAFLNWVRGAFADAPGESNATKWRNFFDGNSASGIPNNMGMWLRNAAIFTFGSVQFYSSVSVNPIPSSPIQTGDRIADNAVRLIPRIDATNSIGSAFNVLPADVDIYGWVTGQDQANGVPYWLLVKRANNTLVWVSADAIQHDQSVVQATPETNAATMAPDRVYSNSDLQTILGA